MRNRDMVIFFLFVFIIYFSVNSYIFIKGYRALQDHFNLALFSIIYITVALTFIAGKILERTHSSVLADILNVVGGFWLAFMLYAFLLLLVSDIGIMAGRLSGIITAENLKIARFYSFTGTLIVASIIILAGFINSVNPVVKRYDLDITREGLPTESARIVAISDIHLGSVVRKRSLRTLSRIIMDNNPNLIFFLGDMVDGEINPVLRDDLLGSLSLPLEGNETFALTGNHEFIGDAPRTIPYIKERGLTLLMDEVAQLESGIQVVGRIDRDSYRFAGKKRKDLGELLSLTDPTLPVIVLDHQPPYKREEVTGEFDLMLSGHTHNGQMWPFSYIVKSLFRNSHGHTVDGRRNYIVSSGYGTWGPRVRIGSRSEVVVIDLLYSRSDR
ncbi:MAG: metallophosphoesterase [Bacteroidales bacterium]